MPKFDILVNAPPEAVFSAISDLTRHAAWAAHNIEIKAVEEGEVKVGSEYQCSHQGSRVREGDRVTVTELVPGSRFAFHARMPNRLELDHTMTISPQDGGTLVSHDAKLTKVPMPMALVKPMLLMMIAVAAGGPEKKFLKNMKSELEGGGE